MYTITVIDPAYGEVLHTVHEESPDAAAEAFRVLSKPSMYGWANIVMSNDTLPGFPDAAEFVRHALTFEGFAERDPLPDLIYAAACIFGDDPESIREIADRLTGYFRKEGFCV